MKKTTIFFLAYFDFDGTILKKGNLDVELTIDAVKDLKDYSTAILIYCHFSNGLLMTQKRYLNVHMVYEVFLLLFILF